MKKHSKSVIPEPEMMTLFDCFEKSQRKKRINDYEHIMSMDKAQLNENLANHGIDGDAAVRRIQQKIAELKASSTQSPLTDQFAEGIALIFGLVKDLFPPQDTLAVNLAMRKKQQDIKEDLQETALPFDFTTPLKKNVGTDDWRIRLSFKNSQTSPIHFEIMIDGQNVACKQTSGSDGKVFILVFPGPDDLKQKFLEIKSGGTEENIFIFNFIAAPTE